MKSWAIASVLFLSFASASFAQISTDEAYQRLQQRAAARAKLATTAPTAVPDQSARTPDTRPAADPDSALLKARANFKTQLRPDAVNPQDDHGQPPDKPDPKIARLIKYRSPAGMLGAYLTPDPYDGKRHPAVVWIHGGFGGLDTFLFSRDQPADNDQTPRAFLDAHFVVMCPSFRGHNDNPGKFEMFYGEVDDAVAAIDYLSKVPYVDPQRIYVVGHSTGGTMTLLAAEASDKIRAAFSLCGCPDVTELTASTADQHHNAPFNFNDPHEAFLRSAINFVQTLKTPTWFFDQFDSMYAPQAFDMCRRAASVHAPFHAFTINPATHYNVVRPLTQLLAAKLQTDTGPTCNFAVSTQEIAAAFANVFNGQQVNVVEAPSGLPPLRVSDGASMLFNFVCRQHNLDPAVAALMISGEKGNYTVAYTDRTSPHAAVAAVNGVRVTMDDAVMSSIGPCTIAIRVTDSVKFVLYPGVDQQIIEPKLKMDPATGQVSFDPG